MLLYLARISAADVRRCRMLGTLTFRPGSASSQETSRWEGTSTSEGGCSRPGSDRAGGREPAIVEELKPETAYFSDMEGARGGYLIVEVEDASQIPAIAEHLFLGLGATIQIHPVTNPENLVKGVRAIGQAVHNFSPLHPTSWRNIPKRDSSNTTNVDPGVMRKAKWTVRRLFVRPCGCTKCRSCYCCACNIGNP